MYIKQRPVQEELELTRNIHGVSQEWLHRGFGGLGFGFLFVVVVWFFFKFSPIIMSPFVIKKGK